MRGWPGRTDGGDGRGGGSRGLDGPDASVEIVVHASGGAGENGWKRQGREPWHCMALPCVHAPRIRRRVVRLACKMRRSSALGKPKLVSTGSPSVPPTSHPPPLVRPHAVPFLLQAKRMRLPSSSLARACASRRRVGSSSLSRPFDPVRSNFRVSSLSSSHDPILLFLFFRRTFAVRV